jgi:O-acetyl-ADP-ribose deacetylase (regulator of RNase III)
MSPETLYLVDTRKPLVAAWEQAFSPYGSVEPCCDDFFSRDADALVSPANSFGNMDGGLDAAIRATLGGQIEQRVQDMIIDRYHGEMPVGAAEVVPTGHSRWPFLVVAPTMRVPEPVPRSLNAYLSFRAALLAVSAFNRGPAGVQIKTLVAPGMGTGTGRIDERRCAAQMRVAYDAASRPARIPSWQMIHELHAALRSAG